MCRARLVGEGISSGFVERIERGIGLEVIDERAATVIDGFSGNRHAVDVHVAMDKADEHPACDQRCVCFDDCVVERHGAFGHTDQAGILSSDGGIGEVFQRPGILAKGKGLESADTNLTCGNARQNGAGRLLRASAPSAC